MKVFVHLFLNAKQFFFSFFSQAMHFCFFNLSFYSIRHSSASISNRSVDIFTEVLKNLNENHSNAWRVNAFNLICYRSTFGNYV